MRRRLDAPPGFGGRGLKRARHGDLDGAEPDAPPNLWWAKIMAEPLYRRALTG